MSTTNDFDRIARAWLADGPTELADRVLDRALREIHVREQQRRWTARWKTRAMERFGVAVAVVLVIVVAGMALRLATTPNAGPAPTDAATPAPTPSAAATGGTVTIDRSSTAGYLLAVPSTWHWVPTPAGFFSIVAPEPIKSVQIWEGLNRNSARKSAPIWEIPQPQGQGVLRGSTLQELVDADNAWYLTNARSKVSAVRSAMIDGEPALVVEHTTSNPDEVAIEAFVTHRDRAYDILLAAYPDSAAALRTAFDQFLTWIRWQPTA